MFSAIHILIPVLAICPMFRPQIAAILKLQVYPEDYVFYVYQTWTAIVDSSDINVMFSATIFTPFD